MYVLTPKTMTVLVFVVIAITFGGILAGFGFALLTERPAREPEATLVPLAPVALTATASLPAPDAGPPAAVAGSVIADSNGAEPIARPRERVAKAPEPAAAPGGISVMLETAQVDRRGGGIEIVIRLANDGDRAWSFPFSPSHNLVVGDNRGNVYTVRWAEYDGDVRLLPGQARRLVKAFFAGPIDQADVRRIQVRARDLPGVGRASWEIEVAP